jgi:CHASE2 domain-containing sensor protein/nitrogen-specific signal transduction histidine kinase
MRLNFWLTKLRLFKFERADDRRFFGEWCGLTFLVLLVLALSVAANVFTPVGNIFFDGVQRMRMQAPNNKIIIVAIDDRSLSELGGWPLPRNLYANFLQNLADSGNYPKAVGFDILMIDPTPHDQALAKQISRHKTVLPAELHFDEKRREVVVSPPPLTIAKSTATISHVNVSFDEDGFIRGSNLVEAGIPHFSVAMSGRNDLISGFINHYSRFSLIRPEIGFTTISLSDALQKNYPLSIFKDAYVLVGSTAPSLGDHYPSIYAGRQKAGTPGVLFQASLLNDILQKSLISQASPQLRFCIYACGLLIILVGILLLSPSTEFILTFSVITLMLIVSILLLLKWNYWLDPTPLVAAVLVIKPIWAWRRMNMVILFMRERAQEMRLNDIAPKKIRHDRFLVRDAVLQYSNVLDQAILLAKNRLDSFEKIINELPEAMFVLNSDDELLLVNKRFQSLFSKEFFKSDMSIDALLNHLGCSLKYLEGLLGLSPGKNHLHLKGVDGLTREYMVHRVEVNFDASNPLSIIMFIEVTELLQFQLQRDRTLQLLSHDMRTPVASILTLCRKMQMSASLSSDGSKPLLDISSHSRRLLSMMDDFILSIRAEESEYVLSTVLFEALLDQAIYEVRDLAQERQMKIRVDEIDAGIFVQVQNRLIERVLINLLVNAIRHGRSATEIVIKISLSTSMGKQPMLRCEFINSIDQPNGSIPAKAEHKGFGLGTSFIDRVVMRHHGLIERYLPNLPEEYATVTIELPVALC